MSLDLKTHQQTEWRGINQTFLNSSWYRVASKTLKSVIDIVWARKSPYTISLADMVRSAIKSFKDGEKWWVYSINCNLQQTKDIEIILKWDVPTDNLTFLWRGKYTMAWKITVNSNSYVVKTHHPRICFPKPSSRSEGYQQMEEPDSRESFISIMNRLQYANEYSWDELKSHGIKLVRPLYASKWIMILPFIEWKNILALPGALMVGMLAKKTHAREILERFIKEKFWALKNSLFLPYIMYDNNDNNLFCTNDGTLLLIDPFFLTWKWNREEEENEV